MTAAVFACVAISQAPKVARGVGRPREDVRVAVVAAVRCGPATLREIVARSRVGYAAARYTIQHSVDCGELVICGWDKRPHAKCWVAIYELADDGLDSVACAADINSVPLGECLSVWSRFPLL